MIVCNIIGNFLREKYRMCQSFNCDCDKCELSGLCSVIDANRNPEKAAEIVQRWSNEHPRKTYKDDFFEKFPNATLSQNQNDPYVCRKHIYGGDCKFVSTVFSCQDCWNEAIE